MRPSGGSDCCREHMSSSSLTENSLLILKGHTSDVCSVAFSRDGALVATSSCDLTLRVFDAKTGAMLHVMEGHTDGVSAVSSPQLA